MRGTSPRMTVSIISGNALALGLSKLFRRVTDSVRHLANHPDQQFISNLWVLAHDVLEGLAIQLPTHDGFGSDDSRRTSGSLHERHLAHRGSCPEAGNAPAVRVVLDTKP